MNYSKAVWFISIAEDGTTVYLTEVWLLTHILTRSSNVSVLLTHVRSFRWGSMVTLWNRSNINSSNVWSWRTWDERYWHQVFIGSLIDMNHLTELQKQAPPVPSDDVRAARSFCSTSGFSVNDWHAHRFSFCFYQ